MIQEIEKFILNTRPLSEDEKQEIESLFQRNIYPKKTILLREGEICSFESYILKGCIKTYFLDLNGQEVILNFATEHWWVSDILSFQEQFPSKMFIETIEETELLSLSPMAKDILLMKYPMLEKMFRHLVQRHLHSCQERLFGNIALSAAERYHIFLKKYPDVAQRIPQHLIASYIGISPEFLSRLRQRKPKR